MAKPEIKESQKRGRVYLRKRSVAARYDITIRTLDRWVRDGVLPPPVFLEGIPFPLWAEDSLDKNERPRSRPEALERRKERIPEQYRQQADA